MRISRAFPVLHLLATASLILTIVFTTSLLAHDDEAIEIERTRLIHGAAGPFAVAGYRMGEAALEALGVSRGGLDFEVVHHSRPEVQWTCIVDGIQAATGASLGKMNLRWEESADGETYTVIRNRKTGRTLHFELAPGFEHRFLNQPKGHLEEAGYATLRLPEREVYVWKDITR